MKLLESDNKLKAGGLSLHTNGMAATENNNLNTNGADTTPNSTHKNSSGKIKQKTALKILNGNGNLGFKFPQSSGVESGYDVITPPADSTTEFILDFREASHPGSVLSGLDNLRRQGQFCDLMLVVENHDVPVHRAVLASCSPYLFDFLSCLEDTAECQPIHKLKDVPYVGFHYLLEFIYTGRLLVPLEDIPVVYGTSVILKMEAPARACANFLSSHLTPANCLGIRRFTQDPEFRRAVDAYIQSNLGDIVESKCFFGLRNIQVEAIGLDENIKGEAMERRLFKLVLDWAKTNLDDLKPKVDRLTEKVNVLYLHSDNTLRDCADDTSSTLSSDDDMIQDYRVIARRTSSNNHNKPASPRISGNHTPFHKFNLNPEEAVSVAERECSVIATRPTSENAYMAIVMLDGQLMTVSAHIHMPSLPVMGLGSSIGLETPPVLSTDGRVSPTVRGLTINPLECMSTARCAMGAVQLGQELLVCGGYDRGDCLRTVESFDPFNNQWCARAQMNEARGRFSAAVLDGAVYVCGGSDGWRELATVERFDPQQHKWSFVASMSKERSSHGITVLGDKLYCIGGCEGQRSITSCEVYDPALNAWHKIAPLKQARSQMCVCTYNGSIYAIGGTDQWNPLNSVEVYSAARNEWLHTSTLNIARRGASVDLVQGQMIVVGGSDGIQSLVSTEILDIETNSWAVGPPMSTPRANLSVVTMGNRLFAVGGFSGKKFLSTVEWLDVDRMEWISHAPRLSDSQTVDTSSTTLDSTATSNNERVEKD